MILGFGLLIFNGMNLAFSSALKFWTQALSFQKVSDNRLLKLSNSLVYQMFCFANAFLQLRPISLIQ